MLLCVAVTVCLGSGGVGAGLHAPAAPPPWHVPAPPLAALVAKHFNLTRCLIVLGDGSDFADTVLAYLAAEKSLLMVTDTGSLVAGDQVIILRELVNSTETNSHIGPLYLLLPGQPSYTYLTMPKLFLQSHVEVYFINNLTIWTLNKSSMNFYAVFSEGMDGLDPFDYKKRTIIVETFNCSIYSNLGEIKSDGHPDWSDGVEMLMWREIAHRLGLEWKMKVAVSFGYVMPNGSYMPGLHLDLLTGRVDLGFCSLWLVPANVRALDYSPPWHTLTLRLIVPRPLPRHLNWSAFASPYEPAVWFAVLGSLLLVLHVNPLIYRLQRITRPQTRGLSGFQMATILAQTNYPEPSRVAGGLRYFFASWVVLTLVLAMGYSSNLVSILTTGRLTPKLRTLEDLAKSECYWGLNTYRGHDKSVRYEEMYSRALKTYVGTKDASYIEELTKSGCYAELGESLGGIFYTLEERPEHFYDAYEASDKYLRIHHISMMLKKSSSLVAPFQQMSLRIIEAGVMEKMFKQVIASERYSRLVVRRAFFFTSSSPSSSFLPLSFSMLLGPFCVLVLGLAFATLALFAEIVIYNRYYEHRHSQESSEEGGKI